MFNEKSFAVFTIDGLDQRMDKIRQEIQPIFTTIGTNLVEELSEKTQRPFYLHIAQHRRRTVHPPENTWAAISEGRRGYKMSPHFQIGIWPEYVFMWLSIIDQPKDQKRYAAILEDSLSTLLQLPADTMINLDHTTAPILAANEETLTPALTRLATVKKAEFQIGRVIQRDSGLWQDPQQALLYMMETYQTLLPLYETLHKGEN